MESWRALNSAVVAWPACWEAWFRHLLAVTLLGGEQPDAASSIAIDAGGTVVVAGTTSSRAFPTRAPFQGAFSTASGFVAGFDANLSHLLSPRIWGMTANLPR